MCQRYDSTEEKKGKGKHISEHERYKIEGYKEIRMSNRKIAKAIGKTHSVINAELIFSAIS